MIESAKVRAFANEMNGYKQAVFAFKVAKNRLPSDLNNDGFFGWCFGSYEPIDCQQTYSASDFPAPYNTASTTPFYYSAPFVDLYLEGLIDFKPDENNIGGGPGKGYPYSKVFKDGYFLFRTFAKNIFTSDYFLANPINYGDVFLYYSNSKGLSPKIFKKLDTIMDDRIYNSGSFRGSCTGSKSGGNNTYDDSIDNNGKCEEIFYNLKLQ